MSYYAPPPQHLPAERTASDLRWAESWQRYGADVDRLLSDPDALRAFVVRCRLFAEAASSASRCEESRRPAGSRGTATVPGPA